MKSKNPVRPGFFIAGPAHCEGVSRQRSGLINQGVKIP